MIEKIEKNSYRLIIRFTLATFGLWFSSAMISSSAHACAVCGFGEDSRYAFISTTALMTFVPLILIGGFIYWIYRLANKAENAKIDDDNAAGSGSASVSSTPN